MFSRSFPPLPRLIAGVALGASALSSLRACGPEFPNSYLAASFAEQTELPTLGFESELNRLLTPAELATRQRQRAAFTPEREHAAELAEVRGALQQAGLAAPEVNSALASYHRLTPPATLPVEFQLYALGARAWAGGQVNQAAAAWRKLLALPVEQRRFRSTWASYMLGRAAEMIDPAAAEGYFLATEDLATKTNFTDSQHLALASIGERAREALAAGEPADALKGYWRQYLLGEPTATASLQFTLRKVFLEPARARPEVTKRMAGDAELRPVVTAWFLARGGPYVSWHREEAAKFKSWLEAVDDNAKLSPAEADRWAWAAYGAGEWAAAQAFADQAPARAPASEWVRALLLVRRGELQAAAAHLARAAQAFPQTAQLAPLQRDGLEEGPDYAFGDDSGFRSDAPIATLGGLRGVLALRRDQYVEALRLFSQAGHWTDAAFVAEKVLTLAELKAYIDGEVAAPASEAAKNERDLRYLCGRRLARAGRFKEARDYYPAELLPVFDTFVAAAARGYDPSQPKQIRATAFWAAAQCMREQGMELVGTELEPDFAIYDGSFQFPSLLDHRESWDRAADPLAPTMEERRRASQSATPSHRFHYRYRALDLAWLAASLSPDDDPATANILSTAGGWIANRDPEAADLFYKALVVRCPNTPQGREAAAKHWLPKA